MQKPALRKNFYPRSPCGERLAIRALSSCNRLFLSTLSLRRATYSAQALSMCAGYFYPRSPCGERHVAVAIILGLLLISIHALLAESDGVAVFVSRAAADFYPRSPCGERRASLYYYMDGTFISIHALLAESDFGPISAGFTGGLFLSTLSLRRATGSGVGSWPRAIFLSTLSLRRATTMIITICIALRFLSTLSLRRATLRHCTTYLNCSHFYPRSPCGERPTKSDQGASNQTISIHALLAESDCITEGSICFDSSISIHALLAESDRQNPGEHYVAFRFLSTLSLRRATFTGMSIASNLEFLSTLSLRRATIP